MIASGGYFEPYIQLAQLSSTSIPQNHNLTYPLSKQNAWQNCINPNLWSLGCSHRLHEVQLRSFGNTVRQTASRWEPARDTRAEDERTTIRVGLERGQGRAESKEGSLDVHGEAGVPVLNSGGIEIAVGREARVALELYQYFLR